MLALSSQLSHAGKTVILDFTESRSTATYLDRLGFFDHLNRTIQVLPIRSRRGLSRQYRGNNDGLIEFRAIDPAQEESEIPLLLERSFCCVRRRQLFSCRDDHFVRVVLQCLGALWCKYTWFCGASVLQGDASHPSGDFGQRSGHSGDARLCD